MTDKTEAPELKPCPFCGGEAEYHYRPDPNSFEHWVSCTNDECAADYGLVESKTSAVEGWNTRTDLHQAEIAAVGARGDGVMNFKLNEKKEADQ